MTRCIICPSVSRVSNDSPRPCRSDRPPLENGIPSHETFSRVFACLDTVAFAECLQKWVESLQLTLQNQGVHIDGKVLRRSFDKAAGKSALQVVTA